MKDISVQDKILFSKWQKNENFNFNRNYQFALKFGLDKSGRGRIWPGNLICKNFQKQILSHSGFVY